MSIVSQIMGVVEYRMQSTPEAAGVVRPVRNQDPDIEDRVIVITHQDIEPDPELSCPGNPPASAFVLPVLCSAVISPPDDDSCPIDEIVSDFYAAMVQAITESGSDDWYRFSNLAINAEIGPQIDYHPGDESSHGAQFITRITYRVNENNPNEIRGS